MMSDESQPSPISSVYSLRVSRVSTEGLFEQGGINEVVVGTGVHKHMKVSRDHWMDAGRFIQTRGLEHEHVWLTKLIFGSQARPRQLHWILSNGKEMFKRRMRGLTGGGSSHSAAGRLSLPWSLSQAISLTEWLKKSVAPERLAPLYQLFIMYVF